MVFLAIGVLAFLIFYFYDFNTVFFDTQFGKKCFNIGAFLLFVSTIGIISNEVKFVEPSSVFVIKIIISVIFLCLLVYSLFFALPKEAFDGSLVNKNVYREGMYALCRHPGVLWLIGFYFFLGVAFKTKNMWIAANAFSILDILYVVIQDMIIFPKQFADYDDYKKTTPFLIPTPGSVKRALGKAHE